MPLIKFVSEQTLVSRFIQLLVKLMLNVVRAQEDVEKLPTFLKMGKIRDSLFAQEYVNWEKSLQMTVLAVKSVRRGVLILDLAQINAKVVLLGHIQITRVLLPVCRVLQALIAMQVQLAVLPVLLVQKMETQMELQYLHV